MQCEMEEETRRLVVFDGDVLIFFQMGEATFAESYAASMHWTLTQTLGVGFFAVQESFQIFGQNNCERIDMLRDQIVQPNPMFRVPRFKGYWLGFLAVCKPLISPVRRKICGMGLETDHKCTRIMAT